MHKPQISEGATTIFGQETTSRLIDMHSFFVGHLLHMTQGFTRSGGCSDAGKRSREGGGIRIEG